MKIKVLLSTLFASLSLITLAQPVLTRNNYFSLGDSCLIFCKYDTSLASVSTGANGSNVQWDFSSLDFNHPSVHVDTVYYISPVGTPYYPTAMHADYSMSNLCYVLQSDPANPYDEDYNYLYTDNDSVSFIGHWAVGGTDLFEDHCTDFIRELSFPFSFPDVYEDSLNRYYYDFSGSDAHFIKGMLTVSAEGYGSMITPDGSTIQNVIKIHSVEATRDSNHVFGITYNSRHYYQWFSSDLKGYILRFEMSASDSTKVSSAYYQKQTNLPTSINWENATSTPFQMNPNPCNGTFIIESAVKIHKCRIEIYSETGKNIYMSVHNFEDGVLRIDPGELKPGLYLVKLISDRIVETKKLVMLHH